MRPWRGGVLGTRSSWLSPTRGHFDLGTGYHGDVWLELDALLLRPAVLRQPVRWMADRLREHAVDAVCGPVEGGAFLAYAVADLLTAAFLPGYRTPGETAGYHLPPVPGGIGGWRVGIVDDAVNAGTAVAACAAAVRAQDAVPVAVTSLLALGDASGTHPGTARRALPPGRHATEPHLARRPMRAMRRGHPAHPSPVR